MTEPTKKDYEIAIDEFVVAQREYKTFEENFLSGDIIAACVRNTGGDPEKTKDQYLVAVDLLRAKLEEMNTKLDIAKRAMRVAATMSPLQWRGPDGKSTSVSYGPFTVQSATVRRFDPKALLKGAARAGVLDRILALTSFDKNGKEYRLIEQSWTIDYANVLKWLKEQKLDSVIDGAYDEVEQTPRVSGAKTLAFFGDTIEK